MIKSLCFPYLGSALEGLRKIVAANEDKGIKTVIFCEDRLSLAAERAVCAAVGGTFLTGVYSFARFLSSERGERDDVLSAQGSAMAIRRIIESSRNELKLFSRLSAAGAAQSVYDTIALLYSSRVSYSDLRGAAEEGFFGDKLCDLALIYERYSEYLKSAGKRDRNEYLRDLPAVIADSPKIRGNCVVLLGFQSFTRSTAECADACFEAARDVYGLFIGGAEDVYVNEALASFSSAAEKYGGADTETVESALIPEAERLRTTLFNPESYHISDKLRTSRVHIYAASDVDDEFEFIAASIKRYVAEGERYAKISVMLPDIAAAEGSLSRVFAEYGIPYYADRRIPLSEHPVCDFLLSYCACAFGGCLPRDVDAAVSSPYFPADDGDKDVFRNYCLRLAAYRGGVRRPPSPEICAEVGFDVQAVERVRSLFLSGLALIPKSGDGAALCAALTALCEKFGVEKKLSSLAEEFADDYPAQAALCSKVYEKLLSVFDEAASLAGDLPAREVLKILKSGFASLEISLIPPKADAVFVGDLAATANTGSNIVFAAGLTDAVPATGADTALLTDREITALERANLGISPKIRQVNMRRREMTGLNLCAFRERLYLSWPARSGGEETRPSEVIGYARAAFSTAGGGELAPLDPKRISKSAKALKYYCSEKIPALRQLAKDPTSAAASAIYGVLKSRGFAAEADAALESPRKKKVGCARTLFGRYNSVTPTALETYFTCPYLNFMRQGLRVRERDEGALRPLDAGNFIHTVMQRLIGDLNDAANEAEIEKLARERAGELLSRPPYSALADSKSGGYTAEALVSEAVKVCCGAYEQLKNSLFKVTGAESACEVFLGDGVKMFGRVDRVDESGDMVRIIDYKTGSVDSSPVKYYMGLKLQLPLYLLASSRGKRPVGAYYFPASVEYKDKADGVFRLQGYMDGSDEVVSSSDVTLSAKEKSAYFDAYLGGKKLEGTMDSEQFPYFINYAGKIASAGARDMMAGDVTPSPAGEACKYCKMGGSCGFDCATGEPRSVSGVKCADIAEIAKNGGGV